MKFVLPLLFLALAVFSDAAVVPNASRNNINIGYVRPGDRLLQRASVYQPPRPNTIQYQDYVYRGNARTRISAIVATEVGARQFASAWITRGGIGYNNVTIRVQSARGYGYNYVIDVWGQ
ncbi:probable salivary secreted peptide [Vanessa atalanta]|uniref:probable salivary secreted peptide n=1 Tax=Vanessa atalanta TaxID=42275 RepID=UPI001FCE1B84|nr:probable salivary secreted peptide [Vanessa atalanta]